VRAVYVFEEVEDKTVEGIVQLLQSVADCSGDSFSLGFCRNRPPNIYLIDYRFSLSLWKKVLLRVLARFTVVRAVLQFYSFFLV
jgi:hypothetical protein